MRKSFHFSKWLLVTLALSLITCEPNERITPETSGSLLLGIELPETSPADGRIDANGKLSILITIENESGETILDQEVLKLTKLNKEFITKPISLVSGNYKIVDFMVIYDLDEVIYITPKEGSPLAYLVDQPVPITFSISKNLVTKLAPWVISTLRKSPKDFGYSSFAFTYVPTFDFLITLFAFNNETNSYELTEGSLQVKAGGEIVFDSALCAGTVQITLPANHDTYELIVTKPLWETASNTYTQGELEQYYSEEDLGPLHIYLNKTTLNNTTFTDSRDGTVYKAVTIGNQVWMAENLKATMFSDGTAIPLVTDNTMWAGLTTPAYSWYNNDKDTYGPTYGALYNWYTVNTGKLCPTGWHVPSYAEWNTLVNYLGGYMVAGGKLKEAGTAHWNSPNTGATNSSGFSALPGGERVDVNGSFIWIGYAGGWWSSTEGSPWDAWIYRLFCNTSIAHSGNDYFKQGALSIRCVKDN